MKLLSFIIVLALALLLIISENKSKTPISEVEHWDSASSLQSLVKNTISNENCNKDLKLFLACVNGINRASLALKDKSFMTDLSFSHSPIFSEKEYLSSWTKKDVNFESILKKLENSIDKDKLNYFYSKIFNGYLSITEDPHTYLMTLSSFKQMRSSFSPKIGINLGKNREDYLVFRTIPKGSSIDKNNIKKGDLILSINDKNSQKLKINEAIQLFNENKELKLKIKKTNGTIYSLNFIKKIINYPDVALEKKEKYNIIHVYKFADETCYNIEEFIKEEKSKPLVLDLRSNGGGLLDSAQCIAGLFLPKKSLVYILNEFGKEKSYSYTSFHPIFKNKLFVLVNSSSASSSELLSGTLQEHKRAVIIGQKTFGKATFQEGSFISNKKDIIRFQTKGLYLWPSEKSPQLYGLTPDILTESVSEFDETEQGFYSSIKPEKNPKKVFRKVYKWNSDDDDLYAVDLLLENKISASNP